MRLPRWAFEQATRIRQNRQHIPFADQFALATLTMKEKGEITSILAARHRAARFPALEIAHARIEHTLADDNRCDGANVAGSRKPHRSAAPDG